MEKRTDKATKQIRLLVSVFLSLLGLIALFLIFFYLMQGEGQLSAGGSIHEKPLIVLDAGHGGFDGGAVAPDGMAEAEINLAFCRILKPILESYGFEVRLTRKDASSLEKPNAGSTIRAKKRSDMQNRLEMMQAQPGSIFISIHQNASPYRSANGSVVYYSVSDPASKQLAEALQAAFIAHLQPENKRTAVAAGSNLYLLKNATGIAVLVECGFLSHAEEYQKLKESDYQKAFCLTLAHTLAKELPQLVGGETSSQQQEEISSESISS